MPGVYNGFTGSQRMRALRWLQAEWSAGRRRRPTRCDVCLQEHGAIEAHSEDYSEPYGDHIGRWGLCYRCHMALHCRFRNVESFDKYSLYLSKGWRGQPMRRNFPQFIREHAGEFVAPMELTGLELPGFAALFAESAIVNERRSGQGLMF